MEEHARLLILSFHAPHHDLFDLLIAAFASRENLVGVPLTVNGKMLPDLSFPSILRLPIHMEQKRIGGLIENIIDECACFFAGKNAIV